MGALLGLGLTHFPLLAYPDVGMAGALKWALGDPGLPDHLREPAQWPAAMQREWASDEGMAAAAAHRSALVDGCRRVRAALDDFVPDAVVVFGDDQYENFREDLIPPFAVLAYGDRQVRPWHKSEATRGVFPPTNIWDEDEDTEFTIHGQPGIARELVCELLEREIDVAYAYEPLHHPGLPHAFANTVLFLDYDRTGFAHPIVPVALNCYGRRVVSQRGGMARMGEPALDPPSPSPKRVMALGSALADAVISNPWRIAVIASSSWSHAFLCDHTYRLHPDTESDRRLYGALQCCDWDTWRAVSLRDIERSGQQEMLNWFALAGAMDACNAELLWSDFVETSIFNSNKVFAIFDSVSGGSR
jgi:hypothetical protein